jgi:hypothetical protein
MCVQFPAWNGTLLKLSCVILCVGTAITFAVDGKEWLSAVPNEQGDALAKRLDGYVKAHRASEWGKLFDFISDAGRGDVHRQVFVAKMKAAHGRDFANSPDLLEFRPERSAKADKSAYEIYGCGKAVREGQNFNGVALIHAVFEHDNWFFSGWTFTEFPNEPCKALSNPSWEAPEPMEWNQPMEELRGPAGVPFHIDKPKQ